MVGGDAGTMTAFMMQRGRQIICGDVGPGLGDSMYDGEIYVGGTVKSLGIDCVESEMTEDDQAMIDRKFDDVRHGPGPTASASTCAARSSTTTTTSSLPRRSS